MAGTPVRCARGAAPGDFHKHSACPFGNTPTRHVQGTRPIGADEGDGREAPQVNGGSLHTARLRPLAYEGGRSPEAFATAWEVSNKSGGSHASLVSRLQSGGASLPRKDPDISYLEARRRGHSRVENALPRIRVAQPSLLRPRCPRRLGRGDADRPGLTEWAGTQSQS